MKRLGITRRDVERMAPMTIEPGDLRPAIMGGQSLTGGEGGSGDEFRPRGRRSPFPHLAQLLSPGPSDIDLFGERLDEMSPRFFDVSDRLFEIGTGEDPLFTQMQGGLFDVLRGQEQRQTRSLEEQFARRGALNTGGFQDALGGLQGQFGNQRTQLANQLAMQRLGVLQQSLDPFSAGIETESLPIQLRIAMENARNAGNVGGGGGGDGLFGTGFGPDFP